VKVKVFDIEADGLKPTKIHCLSAMYNGKPRSTSSYKNMRLFFSGEDCYWVGHNITRFDIPVLERLAGVVVDPTRLIDTLALSWYLQPDRHRHGLESYGVEYGMLKKEIDDWENLSLEEYMARCNRDVEINTRLWEEQYKHLMAIYGDEEEVLRFVSYISFKMWCAKEQERSRWLLDVRRAEQGREELSKEKEEKIALLTSIMPPVPTVVKKTRPKKPFKQDGSFSSHGQAWFDLLEDRGLPQDFTGVVEVITGHSPGNPSSSDQIKKWLYSLGWEPDEFKYVREEDGTVRKIPQINKQTPGEVGVTKSVAALFKKAPGLEVLEGLSVLTHRLSILSGFLENVDEDGYIKAEIQGLTNTLRFKHSVVVNLPGVDKPYGELIRGCLIAPEGYELCGSDMSSLEDRCKQHYIWAYDPDYVREQMAPDFDPHLDLAVSAGAITAEEAQQYKDGVEAVRKRIKPIRHVYKTVNYACVYGAGGPRVAIAAGVPKQEGDKLVETYWKRNWAVKKVAEDCKVKTVRGMKWLYNPVSRFWYSLRAEKDRFSTLCQGTGVYCFDTWVRHFTKIRPQLTAQFHDEVVLCHKKGIRERVTNLLKRAINDTNKELKLNRELDIDTQYGDSYASIH
jgi:hypothetical protein